MVRSGDYWTPTGGHPNVTVGRKPDAKGDSKCVTSELTDPPSPLVTCGNVKEKKAVTRAIIFVKTGAEYEVQADRCLDYCQRRGYEFNGLIRDNWKEADRMMRDGETSVVLIPSETYLDPDRKPRVESVANEPAPSRWETRTRIIRGRDGEA